MFFEDVDEEWRVVPSRSNRPPTHSGSSGTEPKETKGYHHRPPRGQSHTIASDQRVVYQEREERIKENGTDQGFVSQGGRERNKTLLNNTKPNVVRLLRRPARNEDAKTNPPSQTTSVSVMDISLTNTDIDDDMRQKIGAPIFRPLVRGDFSRRQEGEQTGATGQTRSTNQTRISDFDAAEQSMSAVRLSTGSTQSQSAQQDKLGPPQLMSSPPGYQLGRRRDREKEHHRGGLLILSKVNC